MLVPLIGSSRRTYFSNLLVMDIAIKRSYFVVNSYSGTGLRYYASNDCLISYSATHDHPVSTISLSSSSLAMQSSPLTQRLLHIEHRLHPLAHQSP